MRYVINAQASQEIGTGHVMRLSALAEELIARKEEVVFVGKIAGVTWLEYRILRLGFSQVVFNEKDFVPDQDNDVLIFDTYDRNLRDIFIQKSNWKKVILIADATTPNYDADVVFNPNLLEEYLNFPDSDFYSGPLYIPFRKSILKSNRNDEVSSKLRILVVGGGTDPFNFVGSVASILSRIEADFEACLLTNKTAFDFLDSRFEISPMGSTFDSLLASSDLVFTTAGSASLEFVATEIATGIGCAVDNQENYFQNLVDSGVAIPIGRFVSGAWQLDQVSINKLVTDQELRCSLRAKCKNFIDCEGAIRIVDVILKL
jgi:spore coat polysaccharide biosynthesis predicted glycosyltransferase SpsG